MRDRVALVTGASSGIGEEFARQLAARGHHLVLVARRAERLERLAAELPTTAHVIACDLASDAASVPSRVDTLDVEVGLLVNNAGFGTYGRFANLDADREAEMVRLNCEAPVILTRAFLPAMIDRRDGGVINVGSVSGLQPLPYTAVYAASKIFVRSFTAALHIELRGTGVHALTVNPGPVPTEWQRIAGDTRDVPAHTSPQRVVAEALAAYDAKRRALIPGRLARLVYSAFRAIPRPLQLRVTERLYRPAPPVS